MRKPILPLTRHNVMAKVIESLNKRISQKGENGFSSTHEIRGVLDEEVEELHGAIKSNDPVESYNELLDIAVAAIWGLASIQEGTIDW